MKVGVDNYWRLNGINPFDESKSFDSHCFNLVIQLLFWPLNPSKVKHSTVKCNHFLAVSVYFAKVLREISVEK